MSAGSAARLSGRDVCVLISTYRKETAAHLEASLASIAAQTEPVGRVVLVVDGPIDEKQEQIIEEQRRELPLHLVRLPDSGGLARAMNAGLPHCDRSLVMRMDSDDVCHPARVEAQLRYLGNHPEVDVVSSWVREVPDDGSAASMKVSPTEHEHVVRALRWRNVISHPTIMVRAGALRGVGGYRADFGMMEDYDLFVRLAQAGAIFHVLPQFLVDMGTSAAQRRRRGGLGYLRNELAFRSSLLRSGFVTLREFILTTALYVVFRIASGTLRGRLYALVRS